MAVDWSDYDVYEPLIKKYLPNRGEGESKGEQLVTAVNKLIQMFLPLLTFVSTTTSPLHWLFLKPRLYQCENNLLMGEGITE